MSQIDASLDALYAGAVRETPKEGEDPDVPVWRNGRELESWEVVIVADAYRAMRERDGEVVRGAGPRSA